MKIIFESKKYYDAIFEVQSKIRDRLKYHKLTEEEDNTLTWVSRLICDELNERGLKHYWNPKDEI